MRLVSAQERRANRLARRRAASVTGSPRRQGSRHPSPTRLPGTPVTRLSGRPTQHPGRPLTLRKRSLVARAANGPREEPRARWTVELSEGRATALGSSHGTYPVGASPPSTPRRRRTAPALPPFFGKAWSHMAEWPPTPVTTLVGGCSDGPGWVGAA